VHGDSVRGRLELATRKPAKRLPALKKPKPKPAPVPRPKPAPKTAIAAKRKRRRQKVAAGLLAGKTVTELAKEEGLTRSHLSREANQPETRLLMAELLGSHKEQVLRLVGKSLDVIESAFDAGKMGATKEGIILDFGADHFARLTAAKRFVEMITAVKAEDRSEAPGTITWEAFLHLRERIQPA
jgi:hypothetical protein